ncbi:MAG TPA: hypothetical protein PLI60_01785 [Anaerolineaceae bacterium]|nr:hypothetical protein [Anaerolineaceae bacterium]
MKRKFVILIVLYLALLCAPVIYGYTIAGNQQVFNGLAFNPIDGNSYLAKMQLGYQGEWKFTLSYSPEPGQGAYIFLYYIFLGHISRILYIPIILMYHIARIAGALCLALALILWIKKIIKNPAVQIAAGCLLLFGSGMGWLLLGFGVISTDMWVAEAYPFLSGLANPHFPLGLALLLWILYVYSLPSTWKRNTLLFDLTLVLSIVLPFAIVLVAMIIVSVEVWNWFTQRKFHLVKLTFTLIGGGAYLLYQFFSIQNDPMLAQWNLQNITKAPEIYDFLVSFSPSLVLAGVAVWRNRKASGFFSDNIPLIAWIAGGIILLYFPFDLQRRFLSGYFIPVVLIGFYLLDQLKSQSQKKPAALVIGIVGASLITNLIVLAGIFTGLKSYDPHFFLTRDEAEAISWMDASAADPEVVLSSPSLGSFIPARADLKVVYGHPYESIQAEVREEKITQFYTGAFAGADVKAWLREMNIHFVVFGPRELAIGSNPDLSFLIPVQQFGEVQIFRVADE